MRKPASVFVVEDDTATRERLADVIRRSSDFKLAGAVGTLAEAQAGIGSAGPDVLLVDLGLPDGDGAQLIAETARSHPSIQIMVITVFGDEAHVVRAIEAGATGYLLKDASMGEIGRAIGDLLAGGSPISPAVARHVLNRLSARARQPAADPPRDQARLTARETDVLQLVAKGCSYGEVASALSLSVNTVAFHIKQIYRKLAVNSRGEAVFEATQMGLLSSPRGTQD